MKRKEIQRKRMISYFVDAAKEIIKKEGISNLTVRKVGERAGYSYATIYNYFNDLNTLLVYCAFDFLEDCYKKINSFTDNNINCKEQLTIYIIEYFKYFAENPDIFYLVFIQDLGQVSGNILKNNSKPLVITLLENTIIKCADNGYILKDNTDLLGELIASSIHGKLLFFHRREKTDIKILMNRIREEINNIILVK